MWPDIPLHNKRHVSMSKLYTPHWTDRSLLQVPRLSCPDLPTPYTWQERSIAPPPPTHTVTRLLRLVWVKQHDDAWRGRGKGDFWISEWTIAFCWLLRSWLATSTLLSYIVHVVGSPFFLHLVTSSAVFQFLLHFLVEGGLTILYRVRVNAN